MRWSLLLDSTASLRASQVPTTTSSCLALVKAEQHSKDSVQHDYDDTHAHVRLMDCIYGGIVLDNEYASGCHASPQVCPPKTPVGSPTRRTREGGGEGGGGGGRGWREGRVKKQLGQKQQMQRRSYAWKDLYFGITQRLY